MKNKFPSIRLALIVLAVALLSMAESCTGRGQKVISWSDKLTNTVQQFQDQHLLSDQEANDIRSGISDVRAGGVEYDSIEHEVALTKEQKLSKRQRLSAIAQKIIASGQRLEQDGVLHVKNEQARKELERAFALGNIATILLS